MLQIIGMSKADKTLEKLMNGRQDKSIEFSDLCSLLIKLGFEMRRHGGSHRIFERAGFDTLNLQAAGHLAKPYQVRQVRDALKKGGL
jgi:hypothetical protein